jgi:hypothetical protein
VQFVAGKVDEAIRDLSTLKDFDPPGQMAMTRKCIVRSSPYLAQVTRRGTRSMNSSDLTNTIIRTVMGLLT